MNNTNKELVKRTEVEGTPFTIISVDGEGHFISLGKYRVSEVMESIEECKLHVQQKTWDLIMAVMHGMIDDAINRNKTPHHNK